MLVVCIFASALGALIMCLLVLRDGFSPISRDPARADHDVLVTRLGHALAGACFATTAILATVLVARTPAVRVVTAPDPQVTERLTVLDHERQVLGEQVTALGASVQAMREQVGAVGVGVESMRARLDQAEGRVAKAEAGVQRLSDEVAQAIARARQVERPVTARPAAAPARDVVTPPPATRPPVRRAPADVERSAESVSPATPEAVAPAQVTHSPSAAPVAPAPPKPAAMATPAPKAPPAAAATAPAPKAPPAAAATAPRDLPQTSLTDKMRSDWQTIRRGFSSAGDDIADAVRKLGRRGDSGN